MAQTPDGFAVTCRILLIDDDPASAKLVRTILARDDFEIAVAEDGITGLEKITSFVPDVVLLDLLMPGLSGMEILERIKPRLANLPVIVLTSHSDLKVAVRATQLGAFNYLTKPVGHEELTLVVHRACESRALHLEVELLRKRVAANEGLARLMGESDAVKSIVDQVQRVAASNFSVLILGETGTGKELVAQAIHKSSERREQPFIALDCGALPDNLLESELFGFEKGAFTGADRRKEGRFRLAEGGTFFLDEVGNLPVALQAKLLRVLEAKEIQPMGASGVTAMDVRFVAATNHDLVKRVADGLFRSDLYYRLAQYTISIPPLRDRRGDISMLAQRFMAEASVELRRPVRGMDPEAMTLLEAGSWPGNVRQLRNVVRQCVLQTDDGLVHPNCVELLLRSVTSPPRAPSTGSFEKSLREVADDAARSAEKDMIREALQSTQGNQTHAAKALRTDPKTLHLKMKQLGISARDFLA